MHKVICMDSLGVRTKTLETLHSTQTAQLTSKLETPILVQTEAQPKELATVHFTLMALRLSKLEIRFLIQTEAQFKELVTPLLAPMALPAKRLATRHSATKWPNHWSQPTAYSDG